MHGQVAKRVVRHYGTSYDFESATITPGDPVPEWLSPLRSRCAVLLDQDAGELAEALATRYQPRATIGWHRDARGFGDVVGVCLGSNCRMLFQRGKGPDRKVFEQQLEALSAHVLTGSARWAWQHSIPPVAAERFFITFRTLAVHAPDHAHPNS